jgi:indole-3-glycerol phosphate synthase
MNTTDILRSIIAERRSDVERAKRELPVERLLETALGRRYRSLYERLSSGTGTRIIAELKKASPSAGLLRPDYRPEDIAAAYQEAGAAGISVLTEPRHFMGSEQHLRRVRNCVELPVLRKDFICDAYQLAEAAAWGADVVLLIVGALTPDLLRSLYTRALELGLEVLAETHSGDEIVVALELDRAIVGVNSRDLRTLRTDLATARSLAAEIPGERVAVAESGIRERADIEELECLGYNGFLIGETLMKDGEPGNKLKELLGCSGQSG